MSIGLLAVLLLTAFPILGAGIPGVEPVRLNGSFAETSPVPVLTESNKRRTPVFGAWPGRSKSGGQASTGVFTTPAALEFEVAGYPKLPGMRFFLEDAQNRTQRITLAIARDSGTTWRTRRWLLPRQWRGRSARLVVEDTGGSLDGRWLGFTLPREAHIVESDRLLNVAGTMASSILQWGALMFPGLAAVLWFSRGNAHSATQTFTVLMVACGISGLVCFYSFVAGVFVGKTVSSAILVISAAVVVVFWRRLRNMLRGPLAGLLAVWLVSALLYTSAGLLYRTGDIEGEQLQSRYFTYNMPPDNLLPFILAERMYQGRSFRPTYFMEIQSSDRPPLQTGFVLAQRGLWFLPDLQYLLLGVLLQTSWIPALWVLLTRAGIQGRRLLAALAIPALSYFAFVHDTFVWPKLLSATFGLLALSCFGWITGRENTRSGAILGGLATALALLSHSGVVMTVAGFAVLVGILGKAPPRWSVVFIGAAAILYFPWVVYQKFYDPPGDALLKMHLAGVTDTRRSLGSLIVESYTKAGFQGWLAAKGVNIRFLFWIPGGNKLFHGLRPTALGLSELSFFSLFPALGFANAGFIARCFGRPRGNAVADRLLAVCGASLAVWLLVMFAPESTSIHQGSFVTVILLFSALALYMATWSTKGAALLVGLQAIQFLLFVIFAKPLMDVDPGSITDTFPDIGMFGLFIVTFGVAGWWFRREWLQGGVIAGQKLAS